MSLLLKIIIVVLVFSVLVLIHEFGHFIAARRSGIKVEEFGFGLPPRLWGKKKGETLYSINWIPFGGFVRLYGEDSSNPVVLRNKRSFAGRPMRDRVKVIVAGVFMNFVLAWLLLAIGFSVGMQPLLTPADVLPAIESGQVVMESGLRIKNIDPGSRAETLGLRADDRVVAVDGVPVNEFILLKSGSYQVLRGVDALTFQIDNFEGLGVQFYDHASFPRAKIFDLPKHSEPYKAGLRPGDIILAVNGQQVFNVIDFENAVRGENLLNYKIYRDGLFLDVIVERKEARQIIISEVLPDSPAMEAGLLAGDKVLAVNGKEMADGPSLIKFVEEHQAEKLAYLIERHGQRIFYEIQPENARIGVFLSELLNFDVDPGMSLYNVDLLSSIAEVKDEQYPVHIAVFKALGETWRMSKLTGGLFIDVVKNLVNTGKVSEDVAGPVGIAQMTYDFVQEGIIPLLRFVAILSLSLAVINILPIPALDGGRLLFIIIEFVIGRRVSQRAESYVHGLGYLLILALIVIVTYSDIVKLLAS